MGLMEELIAEAKLKDAGSVMAKPQQPQWRKNLPRTLGPTGGTGVQAGLDLLEMVLGLANPVENVSGPSAAIVPTGNRVLQALLEAVRGKAPGLVKKAEGLSETVFPYLVPREMMPVEALGAYRRSSTLPKGELYVRGGRPAGEQIDTLGHELRHFLTGFDPNFINKKPGHALETADQITKMLPPPQRAAMQQYHLPSPSAMPAVTEIVNKLPPGGSGPAADAYNESLSYLTEALMGGNKGGDPMLEAIAEALGQGIK